MPLRLSLEPSGRVSKLLKSIDENNGKDADDGTERKEKISFLKCSLLLLIRGPRS